jgi:hypothetical protein
MAANFSTDAATRSDFWQLDGSHAVLHAGRLQGMIELSRPSQGMTAVRVDGTAQVGWLMGVDVASAETRGESNDQPWDIADVYVRGRDLVVTYREPLEQPFNLQLYWRAVDALGGAPAIDLICSVQTPLWEAHPCVKVESSIYEHCSYSNCNNSANDSPFDLMVAKASNDAAYLETSRPGDFSAHVGVEKSLPASKHWQYGPQFMEKGVIRRLQLRGAFLLDGDVKTSALKLAKELAAEEPALTA